MEAAQSARTVVAFLQLNGQEIEAHVDEQERLMLDLAAGLLTREQLTDWLEAHFVPAR